MSTLIILGFHLRKEWILQIESTFQRLKEIYLGTAFYGKFNKGDKEAYDYYKGKYAKFLNGEADVTDQKGEGCPDEGQPLYSLDPYAGNMAELVDSAQLYYFDMDEDSLPELCLMSSVNRASYIIKYIPDTDQYLIWWKDMGNHFTISGSRKILYSYAGSNEEWYVFQELDNNGEEKFSLHFGIETSQYDGERIYQVSWPLYGERTYERKMPKEMEEQGCFSEQGICYFRVTESQYENLTKEYFGAEAFSLKESVPLSYFLPDE